MKKPDDPNELVVNWVHHDWQVLVWEDPSEVLPWVLRWTGELTGWLHQETFAYSSDALIRAGVITHAVEHDKRLVQPNLRIMSDYTAFEDLVNKLLGFTTASRSSAAQLHHVRR